MPIQVFGEGAIQTAYVSFLNIDLTERSTVLMWPNSYVNLPFTEGGINYNVLAASMIVTTEEGNTNTVTLPDATKGTVGSNFIITNLGASAFNLLKSDGITLLSIPATDLANSYWVELTQNNNSAGIWQTIQFGAGTSSADAAALAGNGLSALGLPAKLNTNTPVQTKSTDYTVTTNDRANLIVWNGGAGTITLPNVTLDLAGFYIAFNNAGTGTLNVKGNAKIDNNAILDGQNVQLKQSLFVICDGVQWWTLGLGQNPLSNLFANGTQLFPSISFLSDDKTGFYYDSPISGSFIGASVNQLKILTIDSIGINTFDTTGNVKGTILTGSLGSSLKWDNGAGNKGTITIKGTGNDNTTLVILGESDNLEISHDKQVTLKNIMPTATAGQMVYYNGANWVLVAAGSDGQVLKLAGTVPTWSAP